MGSCVSSYKSSSSSSIPIIQPPKPSQNNETTFLVEEETVKEVLTETPTPEPPKPCRNLKAFDRFIDEEDTKVHEKQPLFINRGYNTSEICRLRKTIPAISPEKTGKRVNGSPIKLLKNCSFPGDVDERRDRMVHGSRKFGCRDQLGQKMVKEGPRRRRDPGENSYRQQSRSPVTRVDTYDARSFVSRSPSVRRTNRSPVARARTTVPERGRRQTEIPAMESKRSCANESLENPLVSLECFIFL